MSEQSRTPTTENPVSELYKKTILASYIRQNQKAEKGQIVFVGSSLMEYFPIEKMQRKQDLGFSKAIYNRGLSATTTTELLENIDLQIFDLEPSKIFINIGSNDVGYEVLESVFLGNYDEILRQIKEKLPETEVYVMAYYPLNAEDDFGLSKADHEALYTIRTNEAFDEASKKVAQLAKKYNYKFINVNDGLVDKKGNLKKELSRDGVHILPAGYEIILENMRKYL